MARGRGHVRGPQAGPDTLRAYAVCGFTNENTPQARTRCQRAGVTDAAPTKSVLVTCPPVSTPHPIAVYGAGGLVLGDGDIFIDALVPGGNTLEAGVRAHRLGPAVGSGPGGTGRPAVAGQPAVAGGDGWSLTGYGNRIGTWYGPPQ